MSEDAIVYIVDDDAAVRDSMEALLSTADMEAQSFASGQEFLDGWYPARRGCLVLDMRMPGMSGIELLELLIMRGINIPVVMMTAHGDVKMAVRAMKLGAVDFIEKPFNDYVMIESIWNALKKEEHERNGEFQVNDYLEKVAQLTVREREVFDHLVQGESNKVIASKLNISPRTVEIHRARVMEKLEVKNQAKLVKMAILSGLG